jgi:ATP-binding cassette, subfamily B, bacterial PglK
MYRLWMKILPRRRVQLIGLLSLMILVSFVEVISIGAVFPFLGVLTDPNWVFNHSLTQPLIHLLDITEASQLVRPLTFIFATLALIAGAFRLALYWAQARISYAIGADFGIEIYRRSLYQPYIVHLSRNTSEVIAGVSAKADGIVIHAILPFLVIISSSLMLTTIVSVMLMINPEVALTSFIGFGLIYYFVIAITKSRLARYSQLISYEQVSILKILQEALGGIRDVLIGGLQQVYCQIFTSADRRLRKAQSTLILIGGAPRYLVEALGMVMIALLAYTLSEQQEGLKAAIPILGGLALGAQRMLPVFQSAYSNWITLRGGQAALVDTLNLLEQPLPKNINLRNQEIVNFRHSIKVEHIDFQYSFNSSWILRDVNFEILKGTRIGFIGATGSGKSTLVDVIMGLLNPTSGYLIVDDKIISASNAHAWQQCIAHVPQSIYLSDATIAENIAFGVSVENIDLRRMREAAERAQISETIEGWSEKYQTLVGERGVRLSGGQRQRIGIARALYKSADVIVLDEATSALDSETETAVMNGIESLENQPTVLIIAHRLSTLKGCNQIIELEGGTIKRIGSYDAIIGDILDAR